MLDKGQLVSESIIRDVCDSDRVAQTWTAAAAVTAAADSIDNSAHINAHIHHGLAGKAAS